MILKTNKGREIRFAWAAISELDLNLYIGTVGLSVPEAVSIFCDPEETGHLTILMDDQNPDDESSSKTFTNYTRFVQIRSNPVEGTLIVGLGRGGDVT